MVIQPAVTVAKTHADIQKNHDVSLVFLPPTLLNFMQLLPDEAPEVTYELETYFSISSVDADNLTLYSSVASDRSLIHAVRRPIACHTG